MEYSRTAIPRLGDDAGAMKRPLRCGSSPRV